MNRAVTLLALGGSLLSFLLSIIYGSAFFAFLSAMLFAFSLFIWKYGYLFIPLITQGLRIVEVRGEYEIAPTRDYIIKRSPNGYYATKFMEIRFYESSLEKDKEGKKYMFESFERALASIKYMVKITLMISAIDLTKEIEKIKTKRSAAEAKRAKLKRNSEVINKLDREIAMWNRLLDRLTSGEKPVEVISYASTTAFGLTREEAVSKVRAQAKEIKTILASSLGCDVYELKDLEMIRCFEWDYFYPASREELKDEVF